MTASVAAHGQAAPDLARKDMSRYARAVRRYSIGGAMSDLASWQTSGFDVSYGASGPEYDFKLGPNYRKPNLIRFLAFGPMSGALGWAAARTGVTLTLLPLLVFGSAGTVYNGIAYLWRGRFRTRLTARGVEIRGYFNHFVPWSEIRGFEVGGYGRSTGLTTNLDRRYTGRRFSNPNPTSGVRARLGTVHVVRASGRRMMLRAPLVTGWAPDPYFEQKTRQLQELSRQYRIRPPLGR